MLRYSLAVPGAFLSLWRGGGLAAARVAMHGRRMAVTIAVFVGVGVIPRLVTWLLQQVIGTSGMTGVVVVGSLTVLLIPLQAGVIVTAYLGGLEGHGAELLEPQDSVEPINTSSLAWRLTAPVLALILAVSPAYLAYATQLDKLGGVVTAPSDGR